jgi:AcrR family transcriptional regulator
VSGDGAGRPGASRPRQRREREREAARATILAAALGLARDEGWDAVTMRRLAERIEYSANFAYRYFRGRDDILLALVRDGFARLRERMAAAAAAPDGRGPVAPADAVRRAGHAYLDFALAEPDLYRAMYGLDGVHVSTADTFVEGEAVGDLLTALLADAGDPAAGRHVVRLWATAHGLVALLGVGRLEPDTARLHALLDDALDDVLRGVSPSPGGDLP